VPHKRSEVAIVAFRVRACLAVVGLALAAAAPAQPPPAAAFFESKVRPILAENCFKCHGAKKQSGSLRLDSLAAILEGGDQGPAVVPGHPEKSLLLKALRHDDAKLKMPPSGKLSRQHLDDLAR
jgi:hypothetical protein